jgi:AcrR family transcriptional regulator
MVMRYFGNKEALFAAAAEFDLRLPDVGHLPRAAVGQAWSATSSSAGRTTRR